MTGLPIDYESLRVIWWLLLGGLIIAFAVMDGFDLGVGTLLPVVARTDRERRVVINTVGPFWEGNQVWFILGAGAAFAAWPALYAVSFSGFYAALFLVLFPLIMRPVGFKFRSKLPDARWRSFWDWSLFTAGAVPTLVFGIAFGNLLQGVPFSFDADLRAAYTGSFLDLMNPFALLCGLVSLAMLILHGGAWLAVKTEGALADRATRAATLAGLAHLVLFTMAGLWVAFAMDGYLIASEEVRTGPSNPTLKQVSRETGGWLSNYAAHPWTLTGPLFAYLGNLSALAFMRVGGALPAFIGSACAVAGTVATAGLSMFPFILPSSSEPAHSLTVWDASSSPLTLFIMLVATIVFLPAITLYTAWVYRVMRGKVMESRLDDAESQAY